MESNALTCGGSALPCHKKEMHKTLAPAPHIGLDICMHIASATESPSGNVRTGRRENPSIDGPRDRTVCFMLSEQEKQAVDRVAFCMHLTRSGILANVVAMFVSAAGSGMTAKKSEKQLRDYLAECRKAVKKRGAFAEKTIREWRKAGV